MATAQTLRRSRMLYRTFVEGRPGTDGAARGASALATVSSFAGSDGVVEFHIAVEPAARGSLGEQLNDLQRVYLQALEETGIPASSVVFRRFFCSDLANQSEQVRSHPIASMDEKNQGFALSLTGQPPASSAKVAMWAYHIHDPECGLQKSVNDKCGLEVARGGLTHLWATCMSSAEPTPYTQTLAVLDAFNTSLRTRGLTLNDHVLRTWFFVRDIDRNYKAFVTARKELFAANGLTADTHFIASTGIEGAQEEIAAYVSMDAYAVGGIRQEQVRYLAAPSHLSPTNSYGVTFERGTSVTYRDRKHVIISGTASIDNHGAIVHVGDAAGQLQRTIENISALLSAEDVTLGDVASIIAYVRDPADARFVSDELAKRLPGRPTLVVTAAVCRPGWLVELECMAIAAVHESAMPGF